jgi:hypothetical protein
MGKISTKQAYTLFMLAILSPMIRLTPAMGARLAGQAGWVSVFISCAAFAGLTVILSVCFKRRAGAACDKSTDLYSLYKSAFGKVIAKILALFYAIWIFMLVGFYLRAFAERFAGVIMPGVPSEFFFVTLLALVFIILSGRVQSFAIMSDLLFYLVVFAIVVVFALQLPRIQPENLLPVTHYDAGGIVRGVLPTLGIFAYLTPLMFLGGEITCNDTGRFRRYGMYSALILLGVNLMLFAMTVGVFGSALTQEMHRPFMMSVKTVGAQGALERLESIFLLLWVVTDLAIIVMLMHVLLKLAGFLTLSEKPEVFKSLLLSGVFILALYIKRGVNDTELLSIRLGLPANIVMGIIIPVIAVTLCKIKASISRRTSREDTPPITRTPS